MRKYPFQPLPLPWSRDALVPFLTPDQVSVHYNIYVNYINQINKLAQDFPELQSLSLSEMVDRYPQPLPISNVSSQILNHEFFWKTLTPLRRPNVSLSSSPPRIGPPALTEDLRQIGSLQGGQLTGRLYELIVQQYQSLDNFVRQFSEKAVHHFAAGWIWLVYDPSTYLLMIIDGHDAYNPIKDGYIPLINLDVWEHAYFIDYLSERKSYVENYWSYVNWARAEELAADHIFGYRVRVGPAGV